MTVGINAAIGAATGAAGAAASPARMASAGSRILIKAAVGGAASVFTKATERGVENLFYGASQNVFEGWQMTFALGAGMSTAGAMKSNAKHGSRKLTDKAFSKLIAEPKPYTVWLNRAADASLGDKTKELSLTYGSKLALFVSKQSGLNNELRGSGKMFVSDMKSFGSSVKAHNPWGSGVGM